MLMQVQVLYRQGLIKTYLAPWEIMLHDFSQAVSYYGKVKNMRFLPDVDEATAHLLVNTGNAVRLGVKYEKTE